MKKIILLLIILFITCANSAFSNNDGVLINIGLVLNTKKAAFRSSEPFKIFNADKNKLIKKTKYAKIFFHNSAYGIDSKYYKCKKIKLIPGKKPISIFSSYYIPYRGSFILYAKSSSKFFVINEIDINQYLISVLGSEVSSSWPMEALKAQAVAARTYALYKKERNVLTEKEEFDLVDTVQDQVYKGISSESSRFEEAVHSTNNLVMRYDDKIIKAYYHSCCGGYTQDGGAVFEEAGRYLQSVKCDYCLKDGHSAWKKVISAKQIKKAVESLGDVPGKIYFIEPEYDTASGRLDDLLIFHTFGQSILSAVDLRNKLGPSNLRSTNFKITPYKMFNSFILYGKGWGHGVGMCQWGAYGMAKSGSDFEQILNHYYTDIKIEEY